MGCSTNSAAPATVTGRLSQTARKRGESPRGHDIHSAHELAYCMFNSGFMDLDPRLGLPRRMTEKGAFASIAFNEVDLRTGCICQADPEHQPGKSGVGSKVKPRFRPRLERQKL